MNAAGISAAERNTITNSGSITTTGNGGNGIEVGSTNTITNSGSISTAGVQANGISVGDVSTITNLGSITTVELQSNGMNVGNDNVLTNFGIISTEGEDAFGIRVLNRNTIINDGIITTAGAGASGIQGQNDNKIVNSGSISTSGDNARGIDVRDGNTITNSGSITTAGILAVGILANDANVITNSGNISTTEFSSQGIFVGDGNVITNSGNIDTAGDLAESILAGEGNIIVNSGLIRTTGEAFAISVLNNNAITNSGSILTAGEDAIGIIGSDGNTITNSGSIVTTGDDAAGISVNDNNFISNSGSISTAGNSTGAFAASAIDADDGNTIANSGSIVTAGNDANGIFAGSNNAIINSGSITTLGELNSSGIRVLDANTIVNSGNISAVGDGGFGIVADGSGNMITNSGSIVTAGNNSAGIIAQGGNDITNSGSIRTSGSSEGIFAIDGDNVVTNSGLVVSAEADAFRFIGANNTLNLLAPAFIGGRINLGDGTTVNITTGASHSVLWDFSTGTLEGGAPNVDGAVAGFFNADTKQFATLDPTGFAASFDSLGDMTSLLSNVGRQGLSGRFSSRYGSAYGMKDKDGDSDPAIAYGQSLWVTPFGGRTEHEGDDATLDRDITQAGLALGYRWQQQPDLGFGVMAGYVRDEAEAESPFAKSHESEADGFFAGVSGRKYWGNLFLDFAVVGGFMSHDQDRFVNDNLAPLGVSFANASFDSTFISPEAGLSMSFDIGRGLTLTPGARVRYAAQWLDGYTESGSAANASVDDRMLGLLEASAEIAATQRLAFGSVTARLGILGRTSTGDDDVFVSLIGVTNNVAFDTGDDLAGYVGLGASINAGDNLKLELDGQAVLGADFTGVQGLARIIHSF